jgi:Protein of unknown function DUF262
VWTHKRGFGGGSIGKNTMTRRDDEDILLQSLAEEPEGDDQPNSIGWGDYPLDSVFVRTEQRTVGEVVRRIRSDRYDLSPDFQREFLWPIEKQSRLVESCMMRLPLPVFYVAEAKDGRIVVVDGLQRLTTFKRFLGNEFALKFPSAEEEGAKPNPLEGLRFKDLQINLQERIEDTQLTLYVLDAKAPERAKLDIFERVNSGEPLTRQQMRNCLYNGPATRWLRDAADSALFQQATGKSLDRKKMRDREAINRFCAFEIIGWRKYHGDMDAFLADALEEMNSFEHSALDKLQKRFDRAMENNLELFGRHAFRKSLKGDGGRSILNIALFEVCSVTLGRASEDRVTRNAQKLKSAIRLLLEDENFVLSVTYGTNAAKRVRARFGLMEEAVREVLD